jgi:hypothetical protein
MRPGFLIASLPVSIWAFALLTTGFPGVAIIMFIVALICVARSMVAAR